MGERYSTPDVVPEEEHLSVDESRRQAIRSTGLSSGWQFSTGSPIPEWPQRSSELNFAPDVLKTTTSDSAIMGEAWKFQYDTLWTVGAWEDWGLDTGNTMVPNAGFQNSVPPSNLFAAGFYHEPEPTNTYEPQKELVDAREMPSKVSYTSNRSSNVAGKRRASAPSRRSGRPLRSTSLMNTSGQTPYSIPGNLFSDRMESIRDGEDQLDRELEPSSVSQPMASPKSPNELATATTSSSRRSNRITPSRQDKGSRYHKDTERQYRMRLNERFSELLRALPEDVVESASGHSGRSGGDRGLTKIEILALAKAHIATLEKAQSELEEESLVLRGQQELFKRLFGSLGANALSNII